VHRFLSSLVSIAAFGMVAVYCQAGETGSTTIAFQSSTYNDFRQLVTRQPPTATVAVQGKLDFPDQAKDRYPAVIVLHTLSGYRDDNEGYVAAELRKAGFATLTYDTFAARGTTGQALSASPAYLVAGVVDAYAALRRLTSEPRIDASRIAILGFSFGAEIAHLTAFGSLRSALDPGPDRFAAHVAFYPAGNLGVVGERDGYTGSPVLMLLGEKDDNLPLAKIEGYLATPARRAIPRRSRRSSTRAPIMHGQFRAW
jgi:dienelactone hydrolase